MNLMLERFDSNNELSFAECVKKTVEEMKAQERLATALEMMRMGLEREEQSQGIQTEHQVPALGARNFVVIWLYLV